MPHQDPEGERHSRLWQERTLEREDWAKCSENGYLKRDILDRENVLFVPLPSDQQKWVTDLVRKSRDRMCLRSENLPSKEMSQLD